MIGGGGALRPWPKWPRPRADPDIQAELKFRSAKTFKLRVRFVRCFVSLKERF